jgi:hypothetical protein
MYHEGFHAQGLKGRTQVVPDTEVDMGVDTVVETADSPC